MEFDTVDLVIDWESGQSCEVWEGGQWENWFGGWGFVVGVIPVESPSGQARTLYIHESHMGLTLSKSVTLIGAPEKR